MTPEEISAKRELNHKRLNRAIEFIRDVKCPKCGASVKHTGTEESQLGNPVVLYLPFCEHQEFINEIEDGLSDIFPRELH